MSKTNAPRERSVFQDEIHVILSSTVAFFAIFSLVEWVLHPVLEAVGWPNLIAWHDLQLWDYYRLLPLLLTLQLSINALRYLVKSIGFSGASILQILFSAGAFLLYGGWHGFLPSSSALAGLLFVIIFVLVSTAFEKSSSTEQGKQPSFSDRYRGFGPAVFFAVMVLFKEWYALEFDLEHTQYFTNRSYEFLTLAGILLLTVCFAYRFSKRNRIVCLFVCSLLFSFLFLGNVLHYRFFGAFARVSNWEGLFQLTGYSQSVFALLQPLDFLYLVDLPVWLIWIYLCFRNPESTPESRPVKTGILPIVFALLFLFPAAIFSVQFLRGELNLQSGTIDDQFVHVVSLPGFHLLDLQKEIVFQKMQATPAEIERVQNYFSSQTTPDQSPSYGIARDMNVLFLVLESIESFVLEAKVENQPVTPNLREFRARADFSGNLFDVTGTGRSGDAKFSALNGLIPLENQATPLVTFDNEFHALPEILSDRGYQTHSLSGSVASQWKSKQTFRKYGFQQRKFFRDWEPSTDYSQSLPDHVFFPEAVRYLDGSKQPFFSMVISSSSHHPYRLPLHLQKLPGGKYAGTMLGNYYQAMKYLDGSFGLLLEELENQGLRENTAIVIMGDHDAGFPASVRNQLLSEFPLSLARFEQVPLIISLPDGNDTKTIGPGSQADLAPTLLSLIGINPSTMPMFGQDLTTPPQWQPAVIFPDGGFYHPPYLYQSRTSPNRPGQCIHYQDAKPVNKSTCQPLIQRAEQILRLNNLVLRKDLVGKVNIK